MDGSPAPTEHAEPRIDVIVLLILTLLLLPSVTGLYVHPFSVTRSPSISLTTPETGTGPDPCRERSPGSCTHTPPSVSKRSAPYPEGPGSPSVPPMPFTHSIHDTVLTPGNDITINSTTLLDIFNSTLYLNTSHANLTALGPAMLEHCIIFSESNITFSACTWIANSTIRLSGNTSLPRLLFNCSKLVLVNVTIEAMEDGLIPGFTVGLCSGDIGVYSSQVHGCIRMDLDTDVFYAFDLDLSSNYMGLVTMGDRSGNLTMVGCSLGPCTASTLQVETSRVILTGCQIRDAGQMMIKAATTVENCSINGGELVIDGAATVLDTSLTGGSTSMEFLVETGNTSVVENLSAAGITHPIRFKSGESSASFPPGSTAVLFNGSVFTNCSGPGIWVDVPARITGCRFSGHTGTGIYLNRTEASIFNCSFADQGILEICVTEHSMAYMAEACIFSYHGRSVVSGCRMDRSTISGITLDIPQAGTIVDNCTMTSCSIGLSQIWSMTYTTPPINMFSRYNALVTSECTVGVLVDAPYPARAPATRENLLGPLEQPHTTIPCIDGCTILASVPVVLRNSTAMVYNSLLTTTDIMGAGIDLSVSTLARSERVTLRGGFYGVHIDSWSKAYLANSTLSGSYAVHTSSPGEAYLINCTINGSMAGSRIYMYNYIRIHCLDHSGTGIPARVEIEGYSLPMFTTADGWLHWVLVMTSTSQNSLAVETRISAFTLNVVPPATSTAIYSLSHDPLVELMLVYSDLSVDRLSVDVDLPTEGMVVELGARIVKLGPVSFKGVEVALYDPNIVLTSTTIDVPSEDRVITVHFNVTAVSPSMELRVLLTIPDSGIDANDTNNEASITLHVATGPVARLNLSSLSLEPGEPLYMSAAASTSGPGIDSYMFDTGDGGSTRWTTTSFISHNYTTPGTYHVRVRVRDLNGIVSDWTTPRDVLVTSVSPEPPRSPSVTVEVWPSRIDVTVDVHLFPMITMSDGGRIVEYLWDLGDGNTSTVATPVHRYTDDGLYFVSLRVTDARGSTSPTALSTVSVLNLPPVLGLITSIDRDGMIAEPSTPILFNASGSTDPDDPVSSLVIDWNFGDGKSARGLTAIHHYGNAGRYTVNVSATDDDGAVSSFEFIVTVRAMEGDEHAFPLWSLSIIPLVIAILVAFVLEDMLIMKRTGAGKGARVGKKHKRKVHRTKVPGAGIAGAGEVDSPDDTGDLTGPGSREPLRKAVEPPEAGGPSVLENGSPQDIVGSIGSSGLENGSPQDRYPPEQITEEEHLFMEREATSETKISFDTAGTIFPDTPRCLECSAPITSGAVYKILRLQGGLRRAGPFCSKECYLAHVGHANDGSNRHEL